MSGASEGANGGVSGPVLTSRFLFVPDHSALFPLPSSVQAETNAFLRCGEVFWVTVEDNPDPRHATVVLRFTFFLQKKRDYVMFYDFLEHYIPKVKPYKGHSSQFS